MEHLKITRPVLSKRLTQGWGENKACITTGGKIVGTRSGLCPDNSQPFYPTIGLKGHNGLDIATWRGENIHHACIFDGWMKIEKDFSGGIGVDVVSKKPLIFHEDNIPNDLKGMMTRHVKNTGIYFSSYVKARYWHLKAPVGHDKKDVTYGQVIGLADNTGASSGDHLHFGMKWCDKDGNNTIAPSNGYWGAFDPTPFYRHDVFAKDAAEYLNLNPVPLSTQERKEVLSQLSFIRMALLNLREQWHRL